MNNSPCAKGYLIHAASLLDEIIELEEIKGLLVEHGRPFERLSLVLVKLDYSIDKFTALRRVRLIEHREFQRRFRC